ncbi:hypothetical protein SAMN05216436_111118 [bacterium A37T11]|nr:hypothetical protein SAMN05216436_111118 [bacterium A37T11]
MELKGIVSVTGKPGLFKLIGQNKSGFILESLDGQKTKIVVNMSTAKMATLEDITIFGDEDDLKLTDILDQMNGLAQIPDPKKADGKALRTFFREVAPGHDEEKVYSSDIKKIISWFHILKAQGLDATSEEAAASSTSELEEPPVVCLEHKYNKG